MRTYITLLTVITLMACSDEAVQPLNIISPVVAAGETTGAPPEVFFSIPSGVVEPVTGQLPSTVGSSTVGPVIAIPDNLANEAQLQSPVGDSPAIESIPEININNSINDSNQESLPVEVITQPIIEDENNAFQLEITEPVIATPVITYSYSLVEILPTVFSETWSCDYSPYDPNATITFRVFEGDTATLITDPWEIPNYYEFKWDYNNDVLFFNDALGFDWSVQIYDINLVSDVYFEGVTFEGVNIICYQYETTIF